MEVLLLLLLVLPLASFAFSDFPQCRDSGVEFKVGGVVGNYPVNNGYIVVVDASTQPVSVTCKSSASGRMIPLRQGQDDEDDDSEEEDENSQVLFREGIINFWSRKLVRCRHEGKECALNITLATSSPAEKAANCTVSSEELVCGGGIRDLVYEAQKEKSAGDCAGHHHVAVPNITILVFNPDTKNWTSCNRTEGPEKRFLNVSEIQCNLPHFTKQDADTGIVLRLRKTIAAFSPFSRAGSRPVCEDSTYLTVSGEYVSIAERAEEGWTLSYATLGIMLVVATGFVLVICFCCLWQLKLRRDRGARTLLPTVKFTTDSQSFVNPEHSNVNIRLNNDNSLYNGLQTRNSGPHNHAQQNRYSVDPLDDFDDGRDDLTQLIRDSDLNMKCDLQGSSHEINPSLPIKKQTNVLKYDKKFEVDRSSFDIKKVIGSGEFGRVSQAIFTNANGKLVEVAVKEMKNRSESAQWIAILDELKILCYLQPHFSLVNLVGAHTAGHKDRELFILLEFCPYGDLKSFIIKNEPAFKGSLNNVPGHLESEFNWSLLVRWAYSIACGMDYLASKQVMHGDLAARNVLVGDNYSAKITDFGLSKLMYYNQGYKKTERNRIPWAWMAVEYLRTGEFGLKSDVWSFGITVWEIFSLGTQPYGLIPYEVMKVRIQEGERLPCPEPLLHQHERKQLFDQVIVPCWSENQDSRPSFATLKERLKDILGDAEVKQYKVEEAQYLRSMNPDYVEEVEPEPEPRPPTGYIRMESMNKAGEVEGGAAAAVGVPYVEVCHQGDRVVLNQDTGEHGAEVVEKKITELKVELVNSQPGYSQAAIVD